MRKHLPLVLSALLLLASHAHLMFMLAPLDPDILAIQFAFSPQAYWWIIELWGASGLALYRAHFAWDNFHPFVYGAFGYLMIARTRWFDGRRLRRVAMLLLPVAGLFDLVENALQIFLLGQSHGVDSVLIPLSATCSLLKWGLIVMFAIVVGVRWVRQRQQ